MESLFISTFNMSITASYVILAVILARLLLRHAPKKYSYWLWGAVGFRLLIPYSLPSLLSIFNLGWFDFSRAIQLDGRALSYVPQNIGMAAQPQVTVGIPYANSFINQSLPPATPYASMNPMQGNMILFSFVWTLVMGTLLLYAILRYFTVSYQLRTAVLLGNNIYESDRVGSPFVFGLLRPRIYLPFGLSDTQKAPIIAHERFHLRRGDHLIKALSYALACIHWFNPLVWVAFSLMCMDMELSCDEQVLKAAGIDDKKAYGFSLLSFAANRRMPGTAAFSQTIVKTRIKHALHFKQPKTWVKAASILLCLIVLVACAANPAVAAKNLQVKGNYQFDTLVYISPLSSFLPIGDFEQYYTFGDDTLTVIEAFGNRTQYTMEYQQKQVHKQDFDKGFQFGEIIPSTLAESSTLTFLGKSTPVSGSASTLSLYRMDDQWWLINQVGETIWSIYKISNYDGKLPQPPAE